MIILASGRGYFVPLVWVACSATAGLGFGVNGLNNVAIGVLFTGLISSLLGKHWKLKQLDALEKGEISKLKKHSFFFVPLEHLWILSLVVVVVLMLLAYAKGDLYF